MAYNIYWFRHSGPAASQLLCGEVVTDLREFLKREVEASAPDLQGLAAAVERCTTTAAGDTELHLPMAGRIDDHSSAWRPAPGIVAVTRASRPAGGYVEQMLAAACCQPDAALPPLRLAIDVDAPSTDGLLHLLRAFDVNDGLPRGDLRRVRLTASIDAAALSRWTLAPRDCSAAYYPVWGRVAGAVQQSARAWLRFLMLSRPERFLDLPAARAALLYWISAPRVSITDRRLCWDLLADGLDTNPLRNIGARRIACELATVRHHILASPAAPIWAKMSAGRLRQAAWANPSAVHAAANLDAQLTFACTRFAVRLRAAAGRADAVWSAASECLQAMRIALSRSLLAEFAAPLAVVLFFDATAALSRALRRPSDWSMRTEVEAALGSTFYTAREKNPQRRALVSQENPCPDSEPLPLAS